MRGRAARADAEAAAAARRGSRPAAGGPATVARESARRTVDQLADREEADRLERPAGQDRRHPARPRPGLRGACPAIALTDESLRRIENAAAAVDRIGDQLALTSAAVEFTAVADIELADRRPTGRRCRRAKPGR